MDKGKISAINSDPDKMQADIDRMKRLLPYMIEMAGVMAEIRRAHYDAYISKGFSKEEALQLCQKVTL